MRTASGIHPSEVTREGTSSCGFYLCLLCPGRPQSDGANPAPLLVSPVRGSCEREPRAIVDWTARDVPSGQRQAVEARALELGPPAFARRRSRTPSCPALADSPFATLTDDPQAQSNHHQGEHQEGGNNHCIDSSGHAYGLAAREPTRAFLDEAPTQGGPDLTWR